MLISVRVNFAVVLAWSGSAVPMVAVQWSLFAMRLSHHCVVYCCFSSERTHHWLWFPKVTEGYPPAPWWPWTLAKGQHQVYYFINMAKLSTACFCLTVTPFEFYARLSGCVRPRVQYSAQLSWRRGMTNEAQSGSSHIKLNETSLSLWVTADSNSSCLT